MPAFIYPGGLDITSTDAARFRDFVWGDRTAGHVIGDTDAGWRYVADADTGRPLAAAVTWGPELGPDAPRCRVARITWREPIDGNGIPTPCFGWADTEGVDRLDVQPDGFWFHYEDGVCDMGNAVPCVQPAPDRRAAERRAREMLMSLLDRDQRAMFQKEEVIIEVAPSGNRYRLKFAVTGNIERLNSRGRPVERLCVHPAGVPVGDVLATQLLLIRTDEDELRRMANITNPANGQLIQRAAPLARSLRDAA
jgi:hypothetical protein